MREAPWGTNKQARGEAYQRQNRWFARSRQAAPSSCDSGSCGQGVTRVRLVAMDRSSRWHTLKSKAHLSAFRQARQHCEERETPALRYFVRQQAQQALLTMPSNVTFTSGGCTKYHGKFSFGPGDPHIVCQRPLLVKKAAASGS
jgi:hypothetical protein